MNSPVWQIPLGRPPEVVAIGPNIHGFVPIERFCLDVWSLHLYGYHARLLLNGQTVEIRPGCLGITPPGTRMEFHYFGISPHIYVHFRLAEGAARPVAAMTELGSAYSSVYDELFDAAGRFSSEPALTTARVWNALWKGVSLLDQEPSDQHALHRAVRLSSMAIEQSLHGKISVAELAQRVDVTPGYLARLYQDAYGESIVGYVRRRRMERASDLLLHSNLPVKLVASAVGLSDLQQFNKAIRSHFGVGPRALRDTSPRSIEKIAT
jgi:AraC family transcriptional regulator